MRLCLGFYLKRLGKFLSKKLREKTMRKKVENGIPPLPETFGKDYLIKPFSTA